MAVFHHATTYLFLAVFAVVWGFNFFMRGIARRKRRQAWANDYGGPYVDQRGHGGHHGGFGGHHGGFGGGGGHGGGGHHGGFGGGGDGGGGGGGGGHHG